MTLVGEGHRNNFSILVKESKDHAQLSEDKMTSTAAVKYTKSAHSVGSRDSTADMKITAIIENDNAEKDVVPSVRDKVSSAETKQKSPKRQKLSKVGVENQTAGASNVGISSGQRLSSIKRDKKFKHKKHSLWYRLRRRHIHMGVVEVNKRHPFYYRLQAISTGVQDIYADPERLGPLDDLDSDDYTLVQGKELALEDGTRFLFESYAPAVFTTIRRAVSVEEDMYMESIISRRLAYLEFISNSRSGQDFFLSANMRYLIKTNKKRDVEFLLSILGKYLQHFLANPHSLLVKYVGCYSVKFPGKKKIFFLVMQNIFYPADRIEDRFDVKGCTAGRYQEPDPPGSNTITVLKDQNFFQEDLQLGADSDWFISQLTADAMFLRDLNVMDYSLLVGRQKRQQSERERYCLPDLVSRITKSEFRASFTQASPQSTTLGTEETSLSTVQSESQVPHIPQSNILPGTVEICEPPIPVRSAEQKNGLHFPHSLTEIGENPGNQRRRLLPNCSNALHIIDGPEYRYFFGIVDFLTRWTFRQKTARLWKEIKYGCGEHSTMPPNYYFRRFIGFISTRVS